MEEVDKRLAEKFQQAVDASTSTLMELSKMDGIGLMSDKLQEMEKRQMEQDKIV
jgi:DNA integrity scanning protein DisA with diadenylate cyclase activity